MPTSLESRLLAAAQSYAPITALIGSSPTRWYFDTLQQGSAFPAVVTQLISKGAQYRVDARMQTTFNRVQFTLWGGQFAAGVTARDALADALASFMDNFSGAGITGINQQSNILLIDRNALYVQTDPPIYQRIVDYNIFSNDTL